MGGLSIILMFFFLWPLFLAVWLLDFLDMALPVIAAVLTAWNGLILALMAWLQLWGPARRLWDRAYIDSQADGKQVLFLVLRWALLLLTAWAALLLLVCIAYLIWRPSLLGFLG